MANVYQEQLDMPLIYKYNYCPEEKEWLGIIYQEYDGDLLILNVGCERTETEILAWCQGALKDPKFPDMYDRTF